jgi:methyl-accepting chemotaxis protein
MQERLRFIASDADDDARLLAQLRAAPGLQDQVVARWDERLSHVPRLRELVESTVPTDRRHEGVRKHFDALLASDHSAQTVAAHQAIGRAYDRMGYPPEYFALAFQSHAEAVLERSSDDGAETARTLGALTRAMLLDVTVMLTAQVTSQEARITEELDEARAREADAQAEVARLSEALAAAAERSERSAHAVGDGAGALAGRLTEVAELGAGAAGAASEGRRVVDEAVEIVAATRSGLLEADAAAAELETTSHEIARVTGLISGIARQSDLLALAAAIEAARVGGSGAGFAVVADQVRALSRDTASSLAEIEAKVAESRRQVEAVRLAAGTGRERAERLAGDVAEVRERLTAIGAATDQSAAGLEEIGAASEELAAASQEGSAAAAEVTSLAARLAGLAEELRAQEG